MKVETAVAEDTLSKNQIELVSLTKGESETKYEPKVNKRNLYLLSFAFGQSAMQCGFAISGHN